MSTCNENESKIVQIPTANKPQVHNHQCTGESRFNANFPSTRIMLTNICSKLHALKVGKVLTLINITAQSPKNIISQTIGGFAAINALQVERINSLFQLYVNTGKSTFYITIHIYKDNNISLWPKL